MQLRNVLAAATASVVLSGSVVNAALVLDLRIAGGGGKTANVAAIGDVLTLELFGVLPDLNAGADTITGGNSGARSTGTTLGNYTSAIASPGFSGTAHQDTDGPTVIVPGDRDGDTDLDIGGALTTSAVNWFAGRAPVASPGTNQLLGTFIWQVTTLGAANSTTNLNAFVRAATAGYSFVEDGVGKNGTAGNVVLGTPIVVTVTGAATSDQIGLSVDPANNFGLTASDDQGDLTTAGSNGSYSSSIFDDATPSNVGFVDVLGTLPTPAGDSPTLVLADIDNLSDAFLDALTSPTAGFKYFSTVSTGADAEFDSSALFSAEFNTLNTAFGGGFNTLFSFTTPALATPGSLDVDYSFLANAGVQVDRMVVVPEPTSMALIGLGAVALLHRRRRQA